MDKDKIKTVAIILIIAIVAIVGIVFIGGNKKEIAGIDKYTSKVSKEFENRLIKNYKDMRKFAREISLETVSRNYESQNALELFNEEYFNTKKIAAISIYEDNASDYEYHIDDVTYNEDKTVATISYTNKVSGYNGSVQSSWVNCFIIELEGTVTSVEFLENKE